MIESQKDLRWRIAQESKLRVRPPLCWLLNQAISHSANTDGAPNIGSARHWGVSAGQNGREVFFMRSGMEEERAHIKSWGN